MGVESIIIRDNSAYVKAEEVLDLLKKVEGKIDKVESDIAKIQTDVTQIKDDVKLVP